MEPNFAHAWLHVHFAFYPIFCKNIPMEWANPEKIQTGGVEDMEFPGVSRK